MLCTVLFSTVTVSVCGIFGIIKEKNIYQKAAEKGEDIKNTDKEGNFAYEDLSYLSDKDALCVEDEFTDDPKVNIYNKMLNTVDYINCMCLTMKTSMLYEYITTVEFSMDIDAGVSYESVKHEDTVISETYSRDGNMVFVDNTNRTYENNYLPTYSREDTPYIPLGDRIVNGDDGLPCYSYRRNITNCPLASYCIVPQEITFSYLKDFDKWEIVQEDATYLGRDCICIEGVPSPYIAEKHGIDSFCMTVDRQSGILLSFYGLKNGEIVCYTLVTECSFENRPEIKKFDVSDYEGYTEWYRR